MSVIEYIKMPRESAIEQIIHNKFVTLEMADMLLGGFLGQGASRYVFESAMNPDHVIKIDVSDQHSNVAEYECWRKVSHVPKIARWFAPAVSISRHGTIMIMEKARTDVDTKKFPKLIPKFFDDVTPNNFGFIGKRFVCIDYSQHLLWETGMKIEMREIIW